MRKLYLFLALLLLCIHVVAQQGQQSSQQYQWPTDQLVRQKLDQWQDLKFGMIIHWGLYAVPGIVESWALCSEDWVERDSTISYDDFKKWYWGLKNEFNPVNFNPEQWAKTGRDAGMKYLVFTTKHHDGFCMFDTKQTDFKVSAGPFRNNPRADVAKFVFDAFRQNGFMIGAYYSKPDWHSEYFWWPKYSTPDRNTNYDIRKYPWRWNQFKQYTYNQISELMHGYGSIDILWLDGGWVRPRETVNDEVISWGARIPDWSMDVDIPAIAAMARKVQPGLLIVDRTVHGPFEDYRTPEQRIPGEQMDHPWESCVTLGNAWGYVPNDQFKSSTQIIHSLIEIVAKGGSLLLGIGPKADGTLPQEAIKRLEEIGAWIKKNGEAIYNTRTTKNYRDRNTFFTRSKDGKINYALVCIKDNETIPGFIEWKGNLPVRGTKIKLLETGEQVRWTTNENTTRLFLPSSVLKAKNPALAFSFTAADNK